MIPNVIELKSPKIIQVQKGTNFSIDLFINAGTKLHPVQYILNEHDKIYFIVTDANSDISNPLLKKIFTHDDLDEDNCVYMEFESEDTCFLCEGKYYYEIIGEFYDEEKDKYSINNVIQKTKFCVQN